MADEPKKPDEIPAFRISEKKVDDSWKEEIRREREAAAKAESAVAPEAPKPAPGGAAPGQQAKPPEAQPERAKQTKPATAEEQRSKIFLTFLAGLAQQALMQLGDIPSPFSGQREVDLQGARYTIELLTTLQVKTKGNLTNDEAESLESAIGDLKMRYVEIANEVQRQMAAQAQKAGGQGPLRPGPGGTIPGPGFGKRR